MKLIDFITQFPDEQSCRARFKEYRDRIGVICPKCGCTVHYWTGGVCQRYECKNCGYRQSLRANTVMHNSHIPFRVWFIACHLLTSTKSNLSVSEIKRQLGNTSYRSVWWMVQKLRAVMGLSEDSHKLHGEIEIDEAFFKLEPMTEKNSHSHLTPVLVMAESQKYSDKRYKIHRKFGRLKMKVVSNVSAGTLYSVALECIDENAVLRGDGTSCHNYMRSSFQEVSREVLINQSDILRALPWTHLCISDSKNRIRDIYHGVTREYLQLYLDEFCWKKNLRYKNLFDELLVLVAGTRYVWRPIDNKFDMIDFLEKNCDLLGQ